MGRDEKEVQLAVERALRDVFAGYDTEEAAVARIVGELTQLPAFRAYRDLRWKFKNMAKASGKQGATIYELKCQLAELRGLMDARKRADARYERDNAGEEWARFSIPEVIAVRDEQISRQADTIVALAARNKALQVSEGALTDRLQEQGQEIQSLNAQIAGLESKLALARQVRDHTYPYGPFFPAPADVPKVSWNAGDTFGPDVRGQVNNESDQVSA